MKGLLVIFLIVFAIVVLVGVVGGFFVSSQNFGVI
jgi:uncharacterized protein YneF (UPF0154 family)